MTTHMPMTPIGDRVSVPVPSTPTTPDDSHGVRRLIVHPAVWDGIVRFLDVRGMEVTSYGNVDGIPTFGMGIKEFPAPSSVQDNTTPEEA